MAGPHMTTIPSSVATTEAGRGPHITRTTSFSAVMHTLSLRLGLAASSGLLLAWLAPFGTGEIEPFARMGYWTGVMAAWAALSIVAGLAVDRSGWLQATPRVRVLAKALLPVLPMVAVAGFTTGAALDWRPHAGEIVELFLQVILIGSLFELLVHSSQAGRTGARPASALSPALSPPPSPPASLPMGAWSPAPVAATAVVATPEGQAPGGLPRLVERLPFRLRGPILCLQMEDHYVRIHTARGSALVLMRMSDAIAELDGAEGLRVHRSWWVAKAACEDVRQSARATRIAVAGGLSVPVSRPYLEAVLGLAGEPIPAAA